MVGKRTAAALSAVVQDCHRRTGGRVMRLMTSDEYPASVDAIRSTDGTTVVPPRTGRPGRPRKPYPVVPPEVTAATVDKHRQGNPVVRVSTRVVFGTLVAVALALLAWAVSRAVNPCFGERPNGTDRKRCSRNVRQPYAVSKDGEVPGAATRFSHFSDTFCWPVRA